MFDEIYEKYPGLFDEIVDFDPDQICIDDESSTHVHSIEEWLIEPFPSTPDTDPSVDSDDVIKQFLFDVPLDKKEWLIKDPISRRQRSPRLFEFLILLLDKPHYESYASFSDRSKGLFQIYRPAKVAELWQAVKSRQSNQKMTYDKFARAIRWYYKSNIMQKTNTRYTFQFSSKTLKHYFVDENNNTTMSTPTQVVPC
jgi:hypothetical protein